MSAFFFGLICFTCGALFGIFLLALVIGGKVKDE